MKNFIAKYKIEIIASIIGSIAGFAYWFYIGCSTGTCPITSHWYTTVIYGAIMGFLIGQMITDYNTKKSSKSKEENERV